MFEPLEILHEDAACIVLHKPAGLLTQAPLGIESLEFRVKQFLMTRDGQVGEVYLGVPHRLDRPVSGVIVFAKNRKAARRISEQFEARSVEKTYWALVAGNVSPEAGTWVDYLKKIDGEARSEVVAETDSLGLKAVLHFRVQRIVGEFTLLEIQLETGRTHQIRVQCSAHGHPLVGDRLYGSTDNFGPVTDDERARLIALHARTLRFKLPVSKEPQTFVAPLPKLWQDYGVVEPADSLGGSE